MLRGKLSQRFETFDDQSSTARWKKIHEWEACGLLRCDFVVDRSADLIPINHRVEIQVGGQKFTEKMDNFPSTRLFARVTLAVECAPRPGPTIEDYAPDEAIGFNYPVSKLPPGGATK